MGEPAPASHLRKRQVRPTQPDPSLMPVFVIEAFRDELYARRRLRLPNGGVPPTTTVCHVAAWKTPLACPAASPALNQEHLVLGADNEGKARPGHPESRVMHSSAPWGLARPFPDDSLVQAECQVLIMRQHVPLEPLGVQAFPLLYPQVSAANSSSPDFPMGSITLRVQAVDSHPDSCLLICLPAGRFTQTLSLVSSSPR